MANDADVKIGADLSPLDRALRGAQAKLESWGKTIGGIGLGLLGGGLAITSSLIGSLKVFADMGSDMKDMSDRTGVAIEALSELRYAAQQSGASAEDLEKGLQFMSRTIAGAAEGSAEAVKKLDKLHLTVNDLSMLSQDQRFELIADRIADIEDPAQRAAAAFEIFGKGGTKLLPMLADGADGIRKLREEAVRMGLQMSTADATAAEGIGDQISTLTTQFKMLTFTIGSALAPAASEFLSIASDITARVIGFVRENRELVMTLFKVGAALVAVGGFLVGVGGSAIALSTFIGFIGSAYLALKSFVVALVTVVAPFVALAAVAIVGTAMIYGFVAAILAIPTIIGIVAARTLYLRGVWQSVWEKITAITAGVIDFHVSAFNWLAARFSWLADQASGAFEAVMAPLREFGASMVSFFASIGAQIFDTLTNVALRLVTMFADLWTTIGATSGGITDALVQGELELAWEIALAGMTLAWAQFSDAIEQMWIEIKFTALNVIDEISAKLLESLLTIKTAMQMAWVQMWAMAKSSAYRALAEIATRSADFAVGPAREILLQQARGLSLEATRATMGGANFEETNRITQQAISDWFDLQTELAQLQTQNEMDRAAQLDEAGQTNTAGIEAAQLELDTLLADTRLWRMPGPETMRRSPPGLDISGNGTALGSFNAAAMNNVGVGPMWRLVEIAQQQVDLLENSNDWLMQIAHDEGMVAT